MSHSITPMTVAQRVAKSRSAAKAHSDLIKSALRDALAALDRISNMPTSDADAVRYAAYEARQDILGAEVIPPVVLGSVIDPHSARQEG